MPSTQEHRNTAKTWQTMVDSNQALLLRKTGRDVAFWVDKARGAGMQTDAQLRAWMRDEHGVTGYAQYAVSWELFGYPEFMLRDADELIEGQYANHPQLRPIADAVLAWAAATEGVEIQMRKGYVSLHSPRRKFAQVTRTTNTAVDVTLRLDTQPVDAAGVNAADLDATGLGAQAVEGAAGRLERVKARADDPFGHRVRLTSPDQVDAELLAILAAALEQNT
jgi:hypothetical protein